MKPYRNALAVLGTILTLLASRPAWAAPPAREVARVQTLARNQYRMQQNVSCPALVRGSPWRHEIALTFDDGPYTRTTPRILQILQAARVPATFFDIGAHVDQHPELVREEVLDGHEVDNHTYSHRRLATLSARDVEWELQNGALAIQRVTGSPIRLFRPPGGETSPTVSAVARALGLVEVRWNDDPADYTNPGAALIEARALRNVRDGEILLLHDGVEQTVRILPDLIRQLQARGYRFVTCSDMASRPGVISVGGPTIAARR